MDPEGPFLVTASGDFSFVSFKEVVPVKEPLPPHDVNDVNNLIR